MVRSGSQPQAKDQLGNESHGGLAHGEVIPAILTESTAAGLSVRATDSGYRGIRPS